MTMASAEFALTTADVYEHAALIGKDIEVIVSSYGKEVIEDIMPKIVFVLEKLEAVVEEQQISQERIQALVMEREQLTIHSKRDEAIQRQQLEKINYLEEMITGDKKELEERIKRLREENNCLCDELDKREEEMIKIRTSGALPGDVEVMVRMKKTIDNQRDQLRLTSTELKAHKREIDALQEHTTRLTEINQQLRKNNSMLEAKLKQDRDNRDSAISDDVGDNEEDASDMEQVMNSTFKNEKKNDSSLLAELNESNAKLMDNNNIFTDSSGKDEPDSVPAESPSKDPNRPRYTLDEMQVLLEERNLYKIKMIALEEELELFKNPEHPPTAEDNEWKEANKKPGGVRSLMTKFLGK